MNKGSRFDKDIIESIQQYGGDILRAEKYLSLEEYTQHGDVSVKQHCLSVAYMSLFLCRKLHVICDERVIVRGALLHDYFLYDWHVKAKWHDWHGFTHAGIALNNAVRDFNLNIREREIIKKHMWPLTVIPPLCKEAWLVTFADKYCSLLETLYINRGRRGKKWITVKKHI